MSLDGTIPGPVWTDGCCHKEGSYVCSFECYPSARSVKQIDLYVFDDRLYGQAICMRYGNECNEYISPGGLADLIMGSHASEEYRDAVKHLRRLGWIRWSKKEASK